VYAGTARRSCVRITIQIRRVFPALFFITLLRKYRLAVSSGQVGRRRPTYANEFQLIGYVWCSEIPRLSQAYTGLSFSSSVLPMAIGMIDCEVRGARFDQYLKGVYTFRHPGWKMELACVRDRGCLQLSGVKVDAAKMANLPPACG